MRKALQINVSTFQTAEVGLGEDWDWHRVIPTPFRWIFAFLLNGPDFLVTAWAEAVDLRFHLTKHPEYEGRNQAYACEGETDEHWPTNVPRGYLPGYSHEPIVAAFKAGDVGTDFFKVFEVGSNVLWDRWNIHISACAITN